MEMMKKTVLYLPNELIIQIFLRLPVKSLLLFKCVCKSWFSLISDSHFANSHFHATHAHRALFISTRQIRSIDLEQSLDDDSSIASFNPEFMRSQPFTSIEIKGSCRGFILFLYGDSTFYVWNPSTGVRKNIPLSPRRRLNLDADYFYGFGYDQSTDDYLMVSMSSDMNSLYLEFFSLRANKWKQVDEGTHIHYSNATKNDRIAGSLFNGVIHWFAHHIDLEKDVIVAFDLMERKLLDIHLPDQFECELDYYSALWVFREYLSLWAWNYDNDAVEIWVMKEYKVHSSWTKTLVLSIDALPANYFSPLCCTKSGDIVGKAGRSRLVKYNDVGKLLGHRSYFNHQHKSDVVMYSESLLSLPEDNVQAKEDGTNKKKNEVVKYSPFFS